MKIVIKVGTSTLAHAGGHLNIRRVEELCKVLSDLKNAGHELILVSSGAIGNSVTSMGYGAFYDCTGLTDIYCEAVSQPSGWSSYWRNDCTATVHWGYKAK